jgi:hypothetical protein
MTYRSVDQLTKKTYKNIQKHTKAYKSIQIQGWLKFMVTLFAYKIA